MKTEDITVVITSFKSKQKIFTCLNSVGLHTKVIVIENSNDKKLKKQIETDYPNLECFLSEENLGYAKGNNLALSKVKTKYALILNPDATLEKNAINNFLLRVNDLKDFAIIAPMIQTDKDNNFQENDISLKQVNSVKGFAMFLNLKEFENVGFFDRNFFIYFEEIDLCKRLVKENKKIFLDPNIKIFHDGGSSHDPEINFEMELSRNWHWMWSSFYFYNKHYGYTYALLKMSRKFISALLKSIFFLIILKKKKSLIYYRRFSGILNSMLFKNSWYRPKIF